MIGNTTVNTDNLIADALKKCKTHAHIVKDCAKDLEANGFDGGVVADMIENAEKTLKFAHAYQSYINTKG